MSDGDRRLASVRSAVESHFSVAGGELAVGGVPVSRLAAEFGTPLFAYDAGVLRRRLEQLRAAVPAVDGC